MAWDDFKYFLAVARSGSLTHAARALNVSPATVGRRIKALETELDAELFDRAAMNFPLTEAGREVVSRAEEVEQAIANIRQQAIGRDVGAQGIVRVASTEDMAAALIAPNLPLFRDRYPNIFVELLTEMGLVNLVHREADISLRQKRPVQGDLLIRKAGLWRMGLYASKAYAERHGLRPGGVDFSKVGIITRREEWAHLGGEPWLRRHAPGALVALKANSRRVQQSACKAGLGVAVLPSVFADSEPALVCLSLPGQIAPLDIWLVAHKKLARVERVRLAMDFIYEVVSNRARQGALGRY